MKYRKRILKGKIEVGIRELFRLCADVNNWEIQELNIQEDHIHMIVQLMLSISISKVVRLFKGGSSKIIREEFLWGDSFCSDGYFAETVGRVDEEAIREYVKNQFN